jgi:hypothetical protein
VTWVKLDDQWYDHPKFLNVGEQAQLLWVKGLTYACRHRLKGIIPAGAVGRLTKVRNTRQMVDQLVRAGLWTLVDGGYQIHDFDKYQFISDKTSEARSVAGKLGAAKRWHVDEPPDGNCHLGAIGNSIAAEAVGDGSRADARRTGSGSGIGSGSGDSDRSSDRARAIRDLDAAVRSVTAGGDSAQFHSAVEQALCRAGFTVAREVQVELGDERAGRVDLVASRHGVSVGIELDNRTPRGKSILKLKKLAPDVSALVLRDAFPGMEEDLSDVDVTICLRPADPSPEPPGPSGDEVAIALQMRQHAVYRPLDAHRLAPMLAMRAVQHQKRLAWVLEAIDDCAIKSEGLGLRPEALQSKLVGFIRNAKPSKEELVKQARVTEIKYLGKQRPIDNPDVLRLAEGIGRGPKT